MNYRHIYHAGNFADLIKHLALVAILENLCKKDAPFYFLDAFAGTGNYNLASIEASKTNESKLGIKAINEYIGTLPGLIEKYKKIVSLYNDSANNLYPGSPIIISDYLRNSDKADFCELHPEDYLTLLNNIKGFKGTKVHHLDGYQSLKSMLPPKEKRGAILIDPPFEAINEFDKIIDGCEIISKKFGHATVIIWYPIKDYKQIKLFYKNLLMLKKEILKIEFSLTKIESGLASTGILVINPPNIMDEMQINLQFIKKHIFNNEANFTISLLA